VTSAEWKLLEEVGYVRLGVVLTEAEIDRLCQRIDQIMWGTIRYPGMRMQLYPSALGSEKVSRFSGSSLKCRKIEQLEMDPLFLKYIQHPLFRNITRKNGGKVGVFRSMFFNKPVQGSVSLG